MALTSLGPAGLAVGRSAADHEGIAAPMPPQLHDDPSVSGLEVVLLQRTLDFKPGRGSLNASEAPAKAAQATPAAAGMEAARVGVATEQKLVNLMHSTQVTTWRDW